MAGRATWQRDAGAGSGMAARFTELHRRSLLGRTRSRLALDMQELAVGELFDAVVEFPLDEELHLLLVTALHNCGRTTAALGVCRSPPLPPRIPRRGRRTHPS